MNSCNTILGSMVKHAKRLRAYGIGLVMADTLGLINPRIFRQEDEP